MDVKDRTGSGTGNDVTSHSVADLVASLTNVRAESEAFLIATARAAAAESALSIAALELDSATCAIEEAGRALNSSLRAAAIIASRGGAEAACVVLDPTGVLLDQMRNAGASAVYNETSVDTNNPDPVAAAKLLVRDTVMNLSSPTSSSSQNAITLGVLLTTIALQADLKDIVTIPAPVRDKNNNNSECDGVSAAAATPIHTKTTTATVLPSLSSSSTRVSRRSIVNQRSPRGVNPREWTITMSAAAVITTTPSSPTTPPPPPLPFTLSPTTATTTTVKTGPASPSSSPSLQMRASTPIRLAMRAATDLCTTAAGAIAALDAAAHITKGEALNALSEIHSSTASGSPNNNTTAASLTSVPRFAGALASALSGGKDAAETSPSLTRLRKIASDQVELTRQRGTQRARSALGSVRGSLSVELNILQSSAKPTQMVRDQVAVLAGLSADLIAIEKLLQSTAQVH